MKTPLHKFAIAISAVACGLGSVGAGADVAQVATGDGHLMIFEYQGDNLRVNTGDSRSYLLLRDQRLYVVSQGNGQPMVFDMASAFRMFGSMAASATPGAVQGKLLALQATGRKETAAGMQGEVYTLRFVDQDGQEQETQMLLSGAPRALHFRDAIANMVRTMSESVQQEALRRQIEAGEDIQRRLEKLKLGVLRYGTEMQVRSITDEPVADERFELPAEPTDLGAAMGYLLGTGQDGAADGTPGGGLLGNILGGQPAQDANAAASGGAAGEALNKALGTVPGN